MKQAKLLILNPGSSTLKMALFESPLRSSSCEPLWFHNLACELSEHGKIDIERILRRELSYLSEESSHILSGLEDIAAVGYRVVHGGAKYSRSVLLSEEVKSDIQSFSPLAPIHNPAALSIINASEKIFPCALHVVAFDTAFHHSLPPEAFLYAIPYELYEVKGIRKFGFHGINHQYCSLRAAEILEKSPEKIRTVVCHLGNGCSLAAVKSGKSCETTMGFTPLDGLVMGTRSGSVDPGILLHLLSSEKISSVALDHMLNHESGLKALSGGKSGDMSAVVEDMKKGNERAEVAFKAFVHRLKTMVAAMVASMGGIDALVFTAGIGENSPEVRKAVCDGLPFLGLEIEDKRNLTCRADTIISSAAAKTKVLVLAAGEEKAIAFDCARFLKNGQSSE